jgi:hypothetical protein
MKLVSLAFLIFAFTIPALAQRSSIQTLALVAPGKISAIISQQISSKDCIKDYKATRSDQVLIMTPPTPMTPRGSVSPAIFFSVDLIIHKAGVDVPINVLTSGTDANDSYEFVQEWKSHREAILKSLKGRMCKKDKHADSSSEVTLDNNAVPNGMYPLDPQIGGAGYGTGLVDPGDSNRITRH